MMEPGQVSNLGKTLDQSDTVLVSALERFAAVFDNQFDPSGPAQPLWHWLHFLPVELQSSLGEDGHPKRGDFLPKDDNLPRRMWAGSQISFHNDVRPGEMVTRRSTICDIKNRQGRSGSLMFVRVRHEIRNSSGVLLVTDDHDIVYRSNAKPEINSNITAEQPGAGKWQCCVMPDSRLLFRFSAISFNTHRIHYDRPYACMVEGYRGLVVHGPLTAALLLELAGKNMPEATLTSFEFRAILPLFEGEKIFLNANPPDQEGRMKLWASNADGNLAMRANAVFVL